MRTAIVTGAVVGVAALWVGLGCALSNADFIYMCVGAAETELGRMFITPYFPPGYPALLWVVMQAGLSALSGGVVLAAIGAALGAGAIAYVARRWGVPPPVAFALGLLGATLPDVFQITLNPHLDVLYTGLGAVILACALGTLTKPSGPAGWAIALVASVVLLTLRYHAVLLVAPVALVLLFHRNGRWMGSILLVGSALVLVWIYGGLKVTYGGFPTAVPAQVGVGMAYRAQGESAALEVFDDYAAWLESAPSVGVDEVLQGWRANWREFLGRRFDLGGVSAWFPRLVYSGGLLTWLLGLITARRSMPGAVWLVLFILGYTAAVSPTYFTPRASALPELAGVMLLAGGMGALFFAGRQPRASAKAVRAVKLDPALVGMVLFALLLGGIGYNVWREAKIVQHWNERLYELEAANRQALEAAGGERLHVFGPMDLTAWPFTGPGNLPGATYSRLWLDDPLVAPLVKEYIPRYEDQALLSGDAPISVILLWPGLGHPHDISLAKQLEHSWVFAEQPCEAESARLWVRRP